MGYVSLNLALIPLEYWFTPWIMSKALVSLSKLGFTASVLIPQVRPAHKYPNSHWETIQPPGGDNAECMYPHKVYTAEGDKTLTATYQCKTPIPSNKLLVTNILTNN
jgi:hypothetical protein